MENVLQLFLAETYIYPGSYTYVSEHLKHVRVYGQLQSLEILSFQSFQIFRTWGGEGDPICTNFIMKYLKNSALT